MNVSKRVVLFAMLILASACDKERITEVSRVDRQDRKNRILRCLSDCSPRVVTVKKGNALTWAVMVPDEMLGIAVERLRICGLDREPRADLSSALSALDGSDARYAELERNEQARAIEEAIAQHPSVLSVATVLHIDSKRRPGALAGEGGNEKNTSTRGTASVVIRALDERILDTPRAAAEADDLDVSSGDSKSETSSIRLGLDVDDLTEMARGVVRGAGLDLVGVEIVRVPAFASLSAATVAVETSVLEPSAVDDVVAASDSRILGYSLVANAVFACLVLVKLLGRLLPRRTPAQRLAAEKVAALTRPARASA